MNIRKKLYFINILNIIIYKNIISFAKLYFCMYFISQQSIASRKEIVRRNEEFCHRNLLNK